MKSQFARIKNRASSVSTRALAVMLCFVMLLTAVGAGTMMTAIAADGVASPVTDAAQKVIDIADSVDVSAAKAAEDEAPTETVFDKLKQQLSELSSAPKRKKADLAETGLDSGDGIHLGIGTTSTIWHGMGDNAYEFTLQSAATIYYTFSVGGGNFGRGNQGNPGSDSPETNTYYAIKGNNTQFSISLPAGTYRFKLIGTQSGGATLEYQFWKVSSGGGGDEPTPSGDDTGDTTGTKIDDSDLIGVLKRTKIMIYFGDKWGSGTKYVKNGTSATSNATSGTSETLTIDNSDCYVANGYIATDAKYSISNQETSWAGMSINDSNDMTTSQSGNLYYMYKAGSNQLVEKDSTVTVSWSKDSDTIINGTSACGIKATVSGKTGANRDVSVKYFYTTDDTNFYTFNPASTSSMASGTYTIYAAAFDTKVYVAAATQGTLTIKTPVASSLSISANPTELTAVDQTSTITVTATDIASGVTNLTYTIYDRADNSVVGDPVTVTNGATSATFTVTPNARTKSYFASVKAASSAQQALYDEVWTASDATITNSADDYIPRYTVTFSSNNDTYGTVTAKDGSGNAITSGASIKEGDSVTFTATAKSGNEFTGWSEFETKSSSYTRVIRAATTATGNFGPKGYQIIAGDDNGVAMRELSNGTFISANTYADGAWFQIVRNSDNNSSVGNNADHNNNCQYINNSDKHTVTAWRERPNPWNHVGSFANKTREDCYIVYDPSTDEVWLTSDPDDLYAVTVVAKDGTIRYGYQTVNDYTQVFGDTTVELVSPASITGTVDDNAYDGMAVAYNLSANDVRNGVTLKIKTQTKETYVSQGYYVKGFVVSGYEESFSVLWQEFSDTPVQVNGVDKYPEAASYDDKTRINSGYNEFELTISGYPEKSIEITPVYAIKETYSGDNIRFYVEGFAGEVYKDWGGTLAIDAYSTGTARKFGEYPGQPMINYNGRYVVDLPRSGITGITLNNYVWDRIHSNLFYGTTGIGTDTTFNNTVKANNYQTYDFNDFVYLKQVMDASGEDEDMIFSFRYRTSDDHDTKEESQLGKSTYYVNTPNASADKDYDYRKGFNTIDINDSIYHWENLTDFYGNRVDIFGDIVDTKDSSGSATNSKAAYTNPIRIVSNGYDYNKAGNYATAWALYEPVDANGAPAYTGEFHHYQLVDVFGGQGIVNTDYSQRYDSSSYLINPDFQENLRWKYDQSYNTEHSGETPKATFVYDLAKVPTVISYEYQVKDGFSNLNLENNTTSDGEPAYRSDGRWFTTSSNQFLTAHTIIEYAEKDQEDLYHRDYYQGNGIDYTSASGYNPTMHTGIATGIQAYFENSDSDNGEVTGTSYTNTSGNTRAFAVSDGDHEFLLKTVADPDGNYTFKGWYMYTNGKYSFVSRDENYASEATANDVYVARYYKIPSGNVQITHKLHSDSTGFADCEAKVEVVNAANTNTHVGWVQQEFTSEAIKAGSQYIKSNSVNALKITLKTEPDSVSKLDDFYESIVGEIAKLTGNSIADVTGSSVTLDKANNQATVIIPITSFFNNEEQTIKSLPFFSKVSNIPHGDLTVSHEIDPDSTGTGVAKVRVQVLDGNDAQIYDSTQKTDETISLDSTYIRKGASYKINITLETQMGAFSKFNKFWVDYKGTPAQPYDLGSSTGPNGESCNQNSSADKKTYTLTYNFLVDSLFNNNDELKFNELPFYSLIDKPDFKYELTYTYPAYNSSYGNQSYTVKGKFTDNELNSYMIYSNEELSFNTTVDEVRKRTFINGHAPYEDNFTKLIRYDNYSVPARVWDGATSTFKLGVTLDVKQEKVVASFKLPYEYDNATAFNPKPDINTNKVYYNSEAVAVPGLQEIYSRDWYATNGQRTASEDNIANARFVKAPLILTDESTGNDIKYFQYWSVKTFAKYNQDSVEYTRCYDPEFNLAIFQDVIIEPIYSNAFPANMPSPPSKWDDYGRFDPDVLRNQDKTGITITFLENSRNQYNNKAYGDGSNARSIPDSRKGAGDRIYSDFLLSYNGIAGNVELRKEYAGRKKAGLVIEAVAEMDKDGTGKYITDASHYRENENVPAVPTATIEAYLRGETARPTGMDKTEFDVSELDNKNRIQYYYSLTNRPHKALNADDPFMADGVYGNNNKKYFRAYAYIMNNDGTDIQISSYPVYFTIYDMATIENGKFVTNATSN